MMTVWCPCGHRFLAGVEPEGIGVAIEFRDAQAPGRVGEKLNACPSCKRTLYGGSVRHEAPVPVHEREG